MKWIRISVKFEHESIETASELIAAVFYDQGLRGVVIDDPHQDPEQDWADDAVNPPMHHGVTGFIPDGETASAKCVALEKALLELKTSNKIQLWITCSRIDEEDWAESWKEFFWPIKITDHIVIKPTWRDYSAKAGEIIIEIDPGMAFGTGTHPTTALCIRLIDKYMKPGFSFLDVGTGSGILMIIAAKLDASELAGVDIDEMAVNVAKKNLRLNKIPGHLYTVSKGTPADRVKKPFRIVVANILAEVILDLLNEISDVVADYGIFICSGIITSKRDSVLSALQSKGFQLLDILEEETWVAIAARKEPS